MNDKKQALEYATSILKPYIPALTATKLALLENTEQKPDIEECYKVKEVAEKLHCSVRHVWNLIKRGELKATRIANITRIKKSEIEKLIA